MKLNVLETHDRLLEFKKQGDYISQGCEDCIRNRPEEFMNHPFYIFAHKRTIDADERITIFNSDLTDSLTDTKYKRRYIKFSDVPTHRMIWEPRLTKPHAQVNSMLFKAYPPTDNIRVVWIIPDPELWNQYGDGKMTKNKVVSESIYNFKNDINKLEAPETDDLPDERINTIYSEISRNKRKFKRVI